MSKNYNDVASVAEFLGSRSDRHHVLLEKDSGWPGIATARQTWATDDKSFLGKTQTKVFPGRGEKIRPMNNQNCNRGFACHGKGSFKATASLIDQSVSKNSAKQ